MTFAEANAMLINPPFSANGFKANSIQRDAFKFAYLRYAKPS